jgi:sterol desaturase/sphingolipid hydroxylase (fatty acid hydroxylase superfamily)
MEKLLQSLDTAVAITWSRLHNGFLPDEPRLQFTVLTSLVHAIAVYSSALFFMFLKHFSWCKRFRIQGDKEPDRKLVRKCQIHMMISCLIRCHFDSLSYSVPMKLTRSCLSFPTVMYFIVYPISRRSVSHISPAPSASSIFAHLILFVVCEDCMFYWLHRASHHPYLYSYVHKQHHEFKINHPLCFHYSTILEGLFVNTGSLASHFSGPHSLRLRTAVSSLFAPAFMQAHTFTFCIWFFIRVVETVDAHSGYRLPFSPWQILDSVQARAP